ncbi:hypothetical protein HK101_005770 [Irineochytrium annulatum]|nr:hypothetical protein HK101_005770 [Irineochytrium annulatum]
MLLTSFVAIRDSEPPSGAFAVNMLVSYFTMYTVTCGYDLTNAITRRLGSIEIAFPAANLVLAIALVRHSARARSTLSAWRRRSRPSDKTWREWSAGIYSKISFSWLSELIDLAAERPLAAEDLWTLGEYDQGEFSYQRLAKILQVAGRRDNFVVRSLFLLIWRPLLFEYAVSLTDHLFLFANPLFIHKILSTIEDPTAGQMDVLAPVTGLLLISLARTVCESQLYWVNRHIDVKVRAGLVGVIMEKSMRRMQVPDGSSRKGDKKNENGKEKVDGGGKKMVDATAEGKGEKVAKKGSSSGGGMVTNLMSSDTDNILVCIRQSHYLLSVPLLVIACGWLLISTIGVPGAVAGVAALSLAVPATNVIGKRIKSHRRSLLAKSDDRLSRLSELLTGIRVIKLQTWEPFFHKLITTTRLAELASLKSYLLTTVGAQLVWRGAPLFASVATFVTSAVFSGTTNGVDAAAAFTVLAMFNNVLRYPLFIIPKLYVSYMEARVSMTRIEDFLRAPELERFQSGGSSARPADEVLDGKKRLVPGEVTRKVTLGFTGHASFDYGQAVGDGTAACSAAAGVHVNETTPLLANAVAALPPVGPTRPVIGDLDLAFPIGKLSVLIGPTGCGKSSLLLALLGGLF